MKLMALEVETSILSKTKNYGRTSSSAASGRQKCNSEKTKKGKENKMNLAVYATLIFILVIVGYDNFGDSNNAKWIAFYWANFAAYIAILNFSLMRLCVTPVYRWIFLSVIFYWFIFLIVEISMFCIPGLTTQEYWAIADDRSFWLNKYLIIVFMFILYHFKKFKYDC